LLQEEKVGRTQNCPPHHETIHPAGLQACRRSAAREIHFGPTDSQQPSLVETIITFVKVSVLFVITYIQFTMPTKFADLEKSVKGKFKAVFYDVGIAEKHCRWPTTVNHGVLFLRHFCTAEALCSHCVEYHYTENFLPSVYTCIGTMSRHFGGRLHIKGFLEMQEGCRTRRSDD
jgi:hypothetical protein